MHSLGRAALAAMMIVGAATANAQITTVVASPRKTEPAQQAAAQQRERVAQDSVARVAMTGMKEWVDSASAALAIRPDTVPTPADTALATPRAATTPSPKSDTSATARAERQSEFKDGARAPDTATAIPAIGLAGIVLVLAGVAMKRRERTARVHARR